MSADGKWTITLATPMGPQEMTGTFVEAGEKLTGRIDSQMGGQDIEGTVNGDKLAWSMKNTKPMPMTLNFDVTVEGDRMTGKVKLGMFGNADLTAVRA